MIWFALCGRAKLGTLNTTQNCEILLHLLIMVIYANLFQNKQKLLLLPHFFTDCHFVCFI